MRKTVIWVGGAVDEDFSTKLKRAGVDLLVVRRGSIDLTTGSPVIKVDPAPSIVGEIPVSAALRIESGSVELKPEAASALWRGLAPIAGPTTAEIIIDVPTLSPGIPDFVRTLDQVSGLPVVPILTVSQIRTDLGLELAKAAGTIIVPLFGPGAVGLRGAGDGGNDPLPERLASIAATGVRVRVGIVLTPRTDPKLEQWGEDLDRLCDGERVQISTDSKLDRAFVFRRATAWSGREWAVGERFEAQWMDAVRLDSALREVHSIMLPEVVGWDLVTLPPEGGALGIDRRALLAYLEGQGPKPILDVNLRRQGRSLRVSVVNSSPFASVVSGYGNWLEVSLGSGYLAVDGAGTFDRVELGKRVGEQWKSGIGSGVNAVRFTEVLVSAEESLTSGVIRLPSSRSKVTVRWSVTLSDGEVVSGELEG
ncbi:MAG: hypothetical protein DRJ65_05740 [Acidobacteria bacterium]|nr:MAG: hypothetical protein DRJ65_05740 [Acidobacteriota bacterium]